MLSCPLRSIIAEPRPARLRPALATVLAWLLLWITALPAPAWAFEEIPAQVALLVDRDGSQTIESVQHAGFRPVTVPLSLGYTGATTWLRLTIPPTHLPRLVLTMQPQVLDEVRLYRPAAAGHGDDGWEAVDGGDLHPYAQRERAEVQSSFNLSPSGTAPTTVYLRIRTQGSSLLRPWVFSPGDSLRFDSGLHGLIGLYCGMVLCLLGLSLIYWWSSREPIWGYSALFHLLSLLYTGFVLGFAAKYALDQQAFWVDRGTALLGCAHFAGSNLLGWQLMRTFKAPRWTRLVYLVPLAAFPLQLACLLIWDAPRWAVFSNVVLVLVHVCIAPVAMWCIALPDRIVRYLMRSTSLIVAVYVVFYALPLLGIGHISELNVYPALPVNLALEIMQQCVLARHMQLQLRERLMLQSQLHDTATRLDVEERGRREAASFLDMLIHEVKNPLAAIRVAAATLRSGRLTDEGQRTARLNAIQRSVADIDAVLRQCTDTDLLERGAVRVERADHDVAQLLQAEVALHAADAETSGSEGSAPNRIALHAPGLPARVDAGLLRLMLRNLLDNALRYSPAGSTVQVTLSPQPQDGRDGFEIAVRNAAGRAGLPDAQRLFGKYYRAPRAQHLSGTGLGLFWVHEVAALNGGHIRYQPVSSSIDGAEGAEFTLWLPC